MPSADEDKYAALREWMTYNEWIDALDKIGLNRFTIPSDLLDYMEQHGWGLFRLKAGVTEEDIVAADVRVRLGEVARGRTDD